MHMTHFADSEYRRDSKIFTLPPDHRWVCNASLPSWATVLTMWYRLDIPYIFLCKLCVTKFGFRESLMQSVDVEIDRATTFCQQLEDLVVEKGSVTIGDEDRDRLLLAHWAVAF